MIDFLTSNIECVKHRKKASDMYFLGGEFHPIEDISGKRNLLVLPR